MEWAPPIPQDGCAYAHGRIMGLWLRHSCLLYVGAECMWHGRWEAAHVLYRQTVWVINTQVFVQHGKDLVVENLELAYAVNHLLQWLITQNDNISSHDIDNQRLWWCSQTHAHTNTDRLMTFFPLSLDQPVDYFAKRMQKDAKHCITVCLMKASLLTYLR